MIRTGPTEVLRRKADILKRTSALLESGKANYAWKDASRCNCGTLAQVVLGTDNKGIRLRLKGFRWNVAWQYLMSIQPKDPLCQNTRLPVGQLFNALHQAGFSIKELADLETLGDRTICSITALQALTIMGKCEPYENAKAVALYMRNWAELLDKELERRKRRKSSETKTHKTSSHSAKS